LEGKQARHLDDAVEDDVVVGPAARELDEVPAGLGRVLVVHLPGQRTHAPNERRKSYQQQEDEDEEEEEDEERTLAFGTSTVKSPMEVCRVTSGVPPSAPPNILSEATGEAVAAAAAAAREERGRGRTAAAMGLAEAESMDNKYWVRPIKSDSEAENHRKPNTGTAAVSSPAFSTLFSTLLVRFFQQRSSSGSMAPMDPRTEKVVRRTAMVGAVVATYLLLTADYGPNYPNPVRRRLSVPYLFAPSVLCYTSAHFVMKFPGISSDLGL
jgi:hypothetical protein